MIHFRHCEILGNKCFFYFFLGAHRQPDEYYVADQPYRLGIAYKACGYCCYLMLCEKNEVKDQKVNRMFKNKHTFEW